MTRGSLSDLIILKQRILREKQALLEEASALLPDQEALEKLYNHAVSRPYSFLWIALTRQPDEMFHVNFTPPLSIKEIMAL